ncbi:serine phosphatase RsbU (regulator of sigma subunit) [Nocardia transvalensis]|uniref:Serine phosphatase RsbU (Regulator of sigma subunit) n=1 Tax=Nocardia transvalensis TaxID=37333 RepID=A0A7W9PFL7_9NOCA|nr:SpoIIE family protein phosphatase [Nocardia transvalensis]MBB5915185.1 serine phosphatase RsbU (regulator of sigma subunit) [Nocardia transvalensis]
MFSPDRGVAAGSVLGEPRVLLVEDDPGDALLVEELATETVPPLRLTWVRSMGEAAEQLALTLPDCVLLDLNLPDSVGLQALAAVRESAETVPVVVLTGMADEQAGLAAVAEGAQDYLVKGRTEAELLGRAVRYAIQRKQAERATAALRVGEMRARENARLERGLLPTPLLAGRDDIEVVARYRSGRANGLLGGDFYDVVRTGDGAVHALVGDVCGHGPDEAALGVALRIAWRALVLAGISGPRLLRLLEDMLIAERTSDDIFATMTTMTLAPDRRGARLLRAGHPGMLVHRGDAVDWVEVPGGAALGLLPDPVDRPVHEMTLAPGTGLMLFTDGLFEGYAGVGDDRLNEEGLLALARAAADLGPADFVDGLIAGAEALAEERGGLSDDVAAVYLRWSDRETEGPR